MSDSIVWNPSIKRWKGFLVHASEITGIELSRPTYGSVDLTTDRFSFYSVSMPEFPLQFACFEEPNPKDPLDDCITVNKIHDPALALIDWQRQIQEAVDHGRLTDFRTLTTLTAILAYKP